MNLLTGRLANSTPLPTDRVKRAVYRASALTTFAADSVICRLALDGAAIDAATFTNIRLTSGALMLMLIISGVGTVLALHRAR